MKTLIFIVLIFFLLDIFSLASGNQSPTRIPTLVSTKALNDYLKKFQPSRSVRVIETSFNFNAANKHPLEYARGHIPEALYFDLDKCVTSTPYIPRNIPETKCLTEYIQTLGVWPDTHVIVYVRRSISQAFRAWWIFRLFGHKKVSVLDGGFNKWIADGFTATRDIPLIERSTFKPQFDPSLIRNYEDMLANAKSNKEQPVDARSPTSVSGNTAGSGIIPGAKIVFFATLINGDGTMKNSTEIKTIFEERGVNLTLPMVSYCNTGMTATTIAGAAHILGLDIPVYYGSWNEWRQRAPVHLIQLVTL